MKLQFLFAALAAAFVLVSPSVLATPAAYGPDYVSISGVAGSCITTTALIGTSPVIVVEGFYGTIRTSTASATGLFSYVTIVLTSGSVTCTNFFVFFFVGSSGAYGIATTAP
ncbi:MAG: hypothetical protein ACYDCK_14050 [Thermoplasmatota archaeon]